MPRPNLPVMADRDFTNREVVDVGFLIWPPSIPEPYVRGPGGVPLNNFHRCRGCVQIPTQPLERNYATMEEVMVDLRAGTGTPPWITTIRMESWGATYCTLWPHIRQFFYWNAQSYMSYRANTTPNSWAGRILANLHSAILRCIRRLLDRVRQTVLMPSVADDNRLTFDVEDPDPWYWGPDKLITLYTHSEISL